MQDFIGLFFNLLLFLIVFGAILFIAYVTTKFIGKKSNKIMKGKYIKIIETLSLGFDKQIYLLKTGNQYVLLSYSGKNIQFLTTISMDEIPEDLDQDNNTELLNFKEIFEKYLSPLNIIKNKKTKHPENKKKQDSNNFDNNLNKLRGINNKYNIDKMEKEDEQNNEEK